MHIHTLAFQLLNLFNFINLNNLLMITKSLLNTKSPKSSHFEKDMFNNTNFKINDVIDIQVRIKSDKHDDWIKELKIQVSTVNGIINICISDNDDPCFLYKVGISESDFHSIKQA